MPLAVAIVRHQTMPQVELQGTGAARMQLKARSSGTLTGSRLAGALGRLIVADVLGEMERLGRLPCWNVGWEVGFAAWVDNLYTPAMSAANAMAKIDEFEELLQRRWRLSFKPSSKLVTVNGPPSTQRPTTHGSWSYVDEFPVLGHVIEADGACGADVSAAIGKAWRGFWASCGRKQFRKLDLRTKLRDMDRKVLPILEFHAAWWTWSAALTNKVDAVQRRMVALLERVRIQAGEDINRYVRRRGRQAAATCRAQGLWSCRLERRMAAWIAHTWRGHMASSWSSRACRWRGHKWYALQRLRAGSVSMFAGKLGMRIGAGRPRTRWHDGVVAMERAGKITLTGDLADFQ